MLSKLPQIGDSIFSKMTGMAVQHNALNLSQGFPDFDTDSALIDLVYKAMKNGHNQYAPLAGLFSLRERISEMILAQHGRYYDPETEVTVTVGASEGLFNTISAFVHPGDEVIVLKPAYDVYEPIISLQGAVPVTVQLKPPYIQIDWQDVSNAISPKTRMIIINTPHNPSGMVLTQKDMQALENLVKETDILILSDEVYEYMVYDGIEHESAARFPKLAERSLILGSFGKTFHVTGWKMGYCLAPKTLTAEFRKIHQLNVFCVDQPVQQGLAKYLEEPQHYLKLSGFYQHKRDFFLKHIKSSRFKWSPRRAPIFNC